MRVAVIGSGYVGLVSGACFADFGHVVCCIDKDASKIDALDRGEMPIYEPGLKELVLKTVRDGRLSFSKSLAEGMAGAEVVLIAVGTPSRRGDGHADLSFIYQASHEIAAALDGYAVVVTKSTVPVGTGDEVERIIKEARPEIAFAVVSNPEFLREGAAITDFKRPDRIVIGTEDVRARKVMEELYRPLYLNQAPILFTGRRTAELIKYAGNAFLATKITFINEIADLCERVGADVQAVAHGIGLDQPHRPEIPACGSGFRRLLLSEGHAGADPDRRGSRRAAATRRDGGQRQRAAQTRDGAQDHSSLWRGRAGQDDRAPGTDLQTQHRRHAARPPRSPL